jgi:hypothetical protein
MLCQNVSFPAVHIFVEGLVVRGFITPSVEKQVPLADKLGVGITRIERDSARWTQQERKLRSGGPRYTNDLTYARARSLFRNVERHNGEAV